MCTKHTGLKISFFFWLLGDLPSNFKSNIIWNFCQVCSHSFHVLLPFVGSARYSKVCEWKNRLDAFVWWYTFPAIRHFFDCFLTCYVDSMDMMWSKLWDSLSLCRIFWNKHYSSMSLRRTQKIIDALSQIVSPPPKFSEFQNFSHENQCSSSKQFENKPGHQINAEAFLSFDKIIPAN